MQHARMTGGGCWCSGGPLVGVGVQGVGAAHARLFAGAAVALVMVTRAVALRHTAGSPRIFE